MLDNDIFEKGAHVGEGSNTLIKVVVASQIIQTGEGQEDTDSETDDEGEGNSNSDY